jgi:mono/diheme cytochrome c family protein
MKRLILSIGIGLTVIFWLASISAQPEITSVWDGVFSENQATRGKINYEQECAVCHSSDLSGGADEHGYAPSLNGGTFEYRWKQLAVGDLLATISATMPEDSPGSLDTETYTDIISYILHSNNFPAGTRELEPDESALNKILILTAQP